LVKWLSSIRSSHTIPNRLKSRTKWITTSTRVKPPEQTLSQIIPLCEKIGLTRLADITYMDKLYIPNYSAILPGTEDKIWVYSGKGPTKDHAMASAIMEAIERYSSLPSVAIMGIMNHNDTYISTPTTIPISTKKAIGRKFIQGSYSQLSKSYPKVLHPSEVVEAVKPQYNDEMLMDFLPGFDLLSSDTNGGNKSSINNTNSKNDTVLIPASLALFRYSPNSTEIIDPFLNQHTNGLASGNVIEEAICHALCEVIERDAVSIAELCASAIPYTILNRIRKTLIENGYPDLSPDLASEDNKFVDDPCLFPDVDISDVVEQFEPVRTLIRSFIDADIPLLIKDITQEDVGIPTFLASSTEWISSDYGYFVYGHGTHPDARVALIRSITEVSQNRAGNVQGARDDLKKIKFKENDEIYKRLWQFMPSRSENKIVKFSAIKSYSNDDILDDIKLVLSRLKSAGLKRAIIVDLTSPDIAIPVVRSIVPGLETYTVTRSIVGRRAKEHFRKLVS
jgi:thioglycine synthase